MSMWTVLHGNLAMGRPLKHYDSLSSWLRVRVQLAHIQAFMRGELR